MASDRRISVYLGPSEVAMLEELKPAAVSDSAYFRQLLRQARPQPPASRSESLVLLAQSARQGKVQAQVALERALRGDGDRSWRRR